MRPADLAREHGLSAQAIRNYERDGFLPAAARTASGYRIYTETHAAALRAYLALVAAFGYATAGEIMTALNQHRLDDALAAIDHGHGQLIRDRDTLDAVRHLTPVPGTWTVGELAHRLRINPATLRTWEDAGILTPARERMTGYRVYAGDDVRDAELTHLLRRGGYPLEHIATVVRQLRTAGDLGTLLDDWQRGLTTRGLAMLHAAAQVSHYLGRVRPS
jgi:DNA-binding transcriptional MerR regulator